MSAPDAEALSSFIGVDMARPGGDKTCYAFVVVGAPRPQDMTKVRSFWMQLLCWVCGLVAGYAYARIM